MKKANDAYIELMEKLVKSDLPLVNSRSPVHHPISHHDFHYNQRLPLN
jgi:hypothetical protein